MKNRRFRKLLSGAAIAALLLAAPSVFAESPVGRWKTIDDETGEVKSIVKIYESNGLLFGNVEKLLRPADQGKKCEKCPGQAKDKPVEGLMILWNLKQAGDEWSGGQIMDPKNGKIYSCKMRVEGDRLIVRGFLGFSLLGRSQTWIRM